MARANQRSFKAANLVTNPNQPRKSIRFRGRSFVALVLAPEPPLADWLAELDSLIARSPGFFVGRPIVLDVSAQPLGRPELTNLIADLHARDIRITGIEGADPASLSLGLPPAMTGGRPTIITVAETPQAKEAQAGAPPSPPGSLVIEEPVRSGQRVIHPDGDVTVVGSVGSGAEIIAGGSIHIYGALRGRAVAGSTGNARARIYCRKLEAELVAIDGLYQTAENMDGGLRGRPVQAWLEGDAIRMAALD